MVVEWSHDMSANEAHAYVAQGFEAGREWRHARNGKCFGKLLDGFLARGIAPSVATLILEEAFGAAADEFGG